ncbi:sterol-4-alpha-carboxylate 3-dehydrogenase, decarboxylating-like [Octopus sinensis]|uniref:Sterol-4-alpha-carboxylate 3-dehydrogenase, decarboxylating-like n=1 Tax=Octopus sinensis TaxID=2607531 RepID=A0A7E6EHK0_9MOLL|nr:sterol-4-alpha-carboxylate 3-dehydrogenase, decarboxylating-like [Octopus sinensis]
MSCGICVVIGGCGFLGTNLIPLLSSRGYKVRVFDIVRPKEQLVDVEYMSGSLLDLRRCLTEDVSAVFLLASPPPLCQDEKLFIQVNYFGTKNVINVCKEAKIQTVLDANSPELATVALRPHGIFGPGDQDATSVDLFSSLSLINSAYRPGFTPLAETKKIVKLTKLERQYGNPVTIFPEMLEIFVNVKSRDGSNFVDESTSKDAELDGLRDVDGS